MSWLSELAGKAEDILNKIDQNAAVVLKDKTIISDQLTDVIWHNSDRRPSTEDPAISRSSSPPAFSSTPLRPVKSGPSNTTVPVIRASTAQITNLPKKEEEEDFFKFINGGDVLHQSSYSDDLRRSPSGASVASVGSYSAVGGQDSQTESRTNSPSLSSSAVILSRDETEHEDGKKVTLGQSVKENLIDQGRNTHPRNVGSKPHDSSDLFDENEMLRKEIRTLNAEISLLLKRAKAAEEELASRNQKNTSTDQLLAQLNTARSSLRETEKQLAEARDENTRLQQLVGKESSHSEEEMHELNNRIEKLIAERDCLTETTQELTLRSTRLQDTVSESSSQCERLRQQLAAAVSETEQYRARATRVLQEKEQIIASLQSRNQESGQTGGSDASMGSEMWEKQVEQLRRERALDREEIGQLSEHLRTLREELQDSERRLEELRERGAKEAERLQNRLATERARRIAAEDDSKKHSEEVRATRNELTKERQSLNARVREREIELAKLRSPMSPLKNGSSSSSPAELEARVRQLATTLVQKQGALEAVLAERNALRLQLERADRREPLQHVPAEDSTALYISGGDDSGLRSRVPTLLVESPSDTGVTRRVKRAYSSLDTLGIRLGVFLRRYPLVRILVIIYVVVLHLWVLLVLLTYTPEGRSSRPQIVP